MNSEFERVLNGLNTLLQAARAIPGVLQILGEVQRVKGDTVYEGGIWTYLQAPLTSTSWDGDARSTTAKTLIDLSAVFGAPDGIKAVYVYVAIRDSGSAASDCALILGPTDAANAGIWFDCSGLANDAWERGPFVVPCDANGDMYFQVVASGSGTLDAWIQIWGYML